MFGYITINSEELKVRELHEYQAFYCGLCRNLYTQYGRFGQVTLSYDMTFLSILLTGLYEFPVETADSRCIAHPLQKHHKQWNTATAYAADMNILLSYYNLMDDWADDRHYLSLIEAKGIRKKCEVVSRRYLRQSEAVQNYIGRLGQCQSEGNWSLDEAAGLTGTMLGEIFVFQEDGWSKDLRQMGFFLGKFIYLIDAYDDIDEDLAHSRYNPFHTYRQRPDFDDVCKEILMMQMAECCRAFERLPIVENTGILRNILYSGVWTRFAAVWQKRHEKTGDKR